MPTIVFACKSNSCRSQMAEGWARNWLQKQKDDVDDKLNTLNDEGKVNDWYERKMRKQLSLLEHTTIASVALNASAVFEEDGQNKCDVFGKTQDTKEKGTIEPTESDPTTKSLKRKSIKSKAIKAMADDGVDIASYIPKTIDEILPLINKNEESKSFASQTIPTPLKRDYDTINQSKAKEKETLKPVDKLIVLCSCGDELKHQIARRSKSVEEWSIDPPTTAAKNGEGDAAYRRVSLEVKNEVNILMESLIGDVLLSE
jgi:protein-tyrosine-phosphatase